MKPELDREIEKKRDEKWWKELKLKKTETQSITQRDQNLTQYSKQTKKTEVRIRQRERDEKWWKFVPRPFVAKISEGEIR